MTAVIAKLKPNAFSATADKKAAVTTAVASAADSTNSDLTEKSVKLPKAAETEVTAKVKRPAEGEPDHKERIPEPQAKKVKTDSATANTMSTTAFLLLLPAATFIVKNILHRIRGLFIITNI